MARNQDLLTVPAGTIVEITNSDVTGKLTVQNLGGHDGRLLGKADAVMPQVSDFAGALRLDGGRGIIGLTLDDIWPDAGYTRAFVWAENDDVFLTVTHG